MSLWQLSQSLHAQQVEPFWYKVADHLQLWWLVSVVLERRGVLAKRCWAQLG